MKNAFMLAGISALFFFFCPSVANCLFVCFFLHLPITDSYMKMLGISALRAFKLLGT